MDAVKLEDIILMVEVVQRGASWNVAYICGGESERSKKHAFLQFEDVPKKDRDEARYEATQFWIVQYEIFENAFEVFLKIPPPTDEAWMAVVAALEPFREMIGKMREQEADPEVARLGKLPGTQENKDAYDAALRAACERYRVQKQASA